MTHRYSIRRALRKPRIGVAITGNRKRERTRERKGKRAGLRCTHVRRIYRARNDNRSAERKIDIGRARRFLMVR